MRIHMVFALKSVPKCFEKLPIIVPAEHPVRLE
jgi:hypothetical protein